MRCSIEALLRIYDDGWIKDFPLSTSPRKVYNIGDSNILELAKAYSKEL